MGAYIRCTCFILINKYKAVIDMRQIRKWLAKSSYLDYLGILIAAFQFVYTNVTKITAFSIKY